MNALQDTLHYLYSLQYRGMKLGLDRVERFQEALDYPDHAYAVIHVAGTNGKGSTVRYLAAMLQAHGLRVGWYTSPHLIRFNERIRVNGVPITDAAIVAFVEQWRDLIDDLDLTFFEVTTLLAMEHFRQEAVDVAVLETGLGGRLDATNIVTPIVSVVTSIGLEHTDILGETLPEIAAEKAGIFKPGIPCVTGAVPPAARAVFQQRAGELGTPVVAAEEVCRIREVHVTPEKTEAVIHWEHRPYRMELAMIGSQAVRNACIALVAGQTQRHFDLSRDKTIGAVEQVELPGRLQQMKAKPLIYYDVAHNADGVGNLIENLELMYPGRPMQFLLGMNAQKNISAFQELFPGNAVITVLDIPDVPSHSLESWQSVFSPRHINHVGTGAAAVQQFRRTLNPSDCGVITGSHYLAASVYEVFDFSLDT